MASMAQQVARSLAWEDTKPKRSGVIHRSLGPEGYIDAALRWHEKFANWPRTGDWDRRTRGRGPVAEWKLNWPCYTGVYTHWATWDEFMAEVHKVYETRQKVAAV